jgi:hypothetical protein
LLFVPSHLSFANNQGQITNDSLAIEIAVMKLVGKSSDEKNYDCVRLHKNLSKDAI